MAFVRAGIGIEHDHAAVVVPVGDIDLVRLRIDREARGIAEELRIVVPVRLPQLADLQQELACPGELERHMAVAGHPDVVPVIDPDAVFGGLPCQIKRIERDAVAAETRAGIKRHEAKRLGGCRANYLPGIDAQRVTEPGHFVRHADVDCAKRVLQKLGCFGHAR